MTLDFFFFFRPENADCCSFSKPHLIVPFYAITVWQKKQKNNHHKPLFHPCSSHRRQSTQTQTFKTTTKESRFGEYKSHFPQCPLLLSFALFLLMPNDCKNPPVIASICLLSRRGVSYQTSRLSPVFSFECSPCNCDRLDIVGKIAQCHPILSYSAYSCSTVSFPAPCLLPIPSSILIPRLTPADLELLSRG